MVVHEEKYRAKKWQTALLMRLVFGAKTRASQEKVLKELNSLGLHPEGFVPNFRSDKGSYF